MTPSEQQKRFTYGWKHGTIPSEEEIIRMEAPQIAAELTQLRVDFYRRHPDKALGPWGATG